MEELLLDAVIGDLNTEVNGGTRNKPCIAICDCHGDGLVTGKVFVMWTFT